MFFPKLNLEEENYIYNEAEIALLELEEAVTDIKKEKKERYDNRPLTNLFDKVDIKTTKNFEEINNIIRANYCDPSEYTIIKWHIAYEQLKNQAKPSK